MRGTETLSEVICYNLFVKKNSSCYNTFQYIQELSGAFLNKITKKTDLKVLRRSPDLLINVKIGQGQLWFIIETYFVLPWGLWPFWSSVLKQSKEYSI